MHAKVAFFSVLHLLMGLGYSLGFYSANALLISRVGIAPLFYVYAVASLAALGAAGLFYIASRYWRRSAVITGSYLVAGLVVCVAWTAVIALPNHAIVYTGMRACLYAIFVVSDLAFWLIASDTFNNFEAKRGFSWLVAAGILGELLGGWLIAGMAVEWRAVNLLLGWGLLLWACPFLIWVIRWLHPALLARDATFSVAESGSLTFTADARTVAASPLTRALFLFWAIYTFLCYGTDYLFNAVAIRHFAHEDHLAAFFGQVTVVASCVVLGYQLFIAGPLTTRFGVDRTIVVIPLCLLIGLLGYVVHPSLTTIAVAQGLIYYFADYAAVGLLQPVLTVYPIAQRSAVRVYTEGFGRPIGELLLLCIGGLAVYCVGLPAMTPLLLAGCGVLLIWPLWFHRTHLRHLMRCLQSTDRELIVNAIQALGEPNKIRAVKPLLDLLHHADDLSLKQTVVLSLAQMHSTEAFQPIVRLFAVRDEALQLTVLRALSQYKNYEGMFALFRIMQSPENVSYEVRINATQCLTRLIGKRIIPFLMGSLEDPEPRVIANAIESIGLLKDRQAISILRPFLRHAHHRIRANAAIALHPFRAMRKEALAVIDALYRDASGVVQRAGLYAIGALRLTAYRTAIRQLLQTTTEKPLRHFAARALARMGDAVFCGPFLQLLLDRDATIAYDAARSLGTMQRASRLLVFERIAKLSPPHRARLFDTLDRTHLDFAFEKRMLAVRKPMPAPVVL